MAIFSRIAVAATAFAALTVARPLAVRDFTSMVTETAYTTIDVPVTLWVDEHGKPLSTVVPGGNFAASPTPPASTPANTPWAPSPDAGSPKVIQSALPSTPQPAVVPTTTAAPQVPAFTSPSQTPTSQTPTWQTPASQTPTSQTPASQTPAATPTNNAQSGQSGGTVTGSSAASCQGESNACSGDITHWDGGLGACGWNIDTSSDMQIALPFEFMGTASNSNPYCGKSLTIQNPNTGNTVQAKVGDKCMGCTGRSIDLTDALFNAIGGGCDGRCSNFVWWLN